MDVSDERKQFHLDDLDIIPSVIRNFQFFVQPKYRIAASRPGSGNTKNIGSVTKIEQLSSGSGPFAELGEEVYDDYWMYYLTTDMARSLEVQRPYVDLRSYLAYKQRGIEILKRLQDRIDQIDDADAPMNMEESE